MTKRALFFALIALSVSGLLLHVRIHNFMVPDKLGAMVFDPTRFLSFILPLIDVTIVTALFTSRKTAAYGYLLNGLIVIFGTILMAHFSMAYFIAKAVPPSEWLLSSTFPDIGIAWGDFLVGKALYEQYLKEPEAA